MEKTELTVTDSNRCNKTKEFRLKDVVKKLKEENQSLKVIIEEQGMALDIIMRKYRGQVDTLIKSSQLDVTKLFYNRLRDSIVNQANKMNEMTQKLRKYFKIIFKYEEVMKQIEDENVSLRKSVRNLSIILCDTKEKKYGEKSNTGTQTDRNATEENATLTVNEHFTVKPEPKITNCMDVVVFRSLEDHISHLIFPQFNPEVPVAVNNAMHRLRDEINTDIPPLGPAGLWEEFEDPTDGESDELVGNECSARSNEDVYQDVL